MRKYDYLIVGSGISGATFAYLMKMAGKRVLILEKRDHIGGNCYTEYRENIHMHQYGPHIFHTSNQQVWDYLNQFGQWHVFMNRPKVNYQGKIYSFPVNMMTFYQLWGVKTPKEAQAKIREVAVRIENPCNLEEWLLSQVGEEIYRIFFKGYTEKQWNKKPRELPADIVKRVPIRFTYDDNYYNDCYQAIPTDGYTSVIREMISEIDIQLQTDYLDAREFWDSKADRIVYSGRIDELYEYKYGRLDYRFLQFEHKCMNSDYQGNPVFNYTESEIPYTRSIEHKYFGENPSTQTTIVSWEYPVGERDNSIPAYPVNTPSNQELYKKYVDCAKQDGLILLGRLATFSYLDMDKAVLEAIKKVNQLK